MLLFEKVAERLKWQIDEGVYVFRDFPAEKELANSLGVSYMTARRAVEHLVASNILYRKENGRAALTSRQAGRKNLRLALLMPTYKSYAFDRWHYALAEMARSNDDFTFRPITYVHWNDPLLWDALRGYDASFLLPTSEPLSESLAEQMLNLPCPPVILGNDFSQFGLLSVELFSATGIHSVLDHFLDKGHRDIACFNIQPSAPDICQRINHWKRWLAMRRLTGQLLNYPVKPFKSTYLPAAQMFSTILEQGLTATAVLCTTVAGAIGVCRALRQRQLKPGRDLAIAVVDGEEIASVFTPEITALEVPDLKPLLDICLDWIQSREIWTGPLVIRPKSEQLYIRESSSFTAKDCSK